MTALRPLARRLRRMGWSGALAAVLLAGSAGFQYAVLLPARERLDELRATALARRQELRQAKSAQEDDKTPEGQLARFHQAFPADASLPELLDRLFAVAGSQNVHLDQGDYKLTRSAAGKMVRVQIALPLRSSYPQVRKFIAALKAEIPVVALEQVKFERQKVAEANIEAMIKLALYMEPSS